MAEVTIVGVVTCLPFPMIFGLVIPGVDLVDTILYRYASLLISPGCYSLGNCLLKINIVMLRQVIWHTINVSFYDGFRTTLDF